MALGSRWRIAHRVLPALLAALATMAGCQGLPSPKANPNFHAGTEQPETTARPEDEPLPPLPGEPSAGQPKSPAPAGPPQPTPLLDAALARAHEQQQAVVHEVRDPSLGGSPTAAPAAGPSAGPAQTPDAIKTDPPAPASTPAPAQESAEPLAPVEAEPSPGSPARTKTEPLPTAPVADPSLRPDGMPAPVFAPGLEGSEAVAPQPQRSAQVPVDPTPAKPSDQPEPTPSPASASEPRLTTASATESAPLPAPTPAEASPPREEGSQISGSRSDTPAADKQALAIADLRLCRRVLGFRDFEPVDSASCRPGQAVVLYCEMAGVKYVEADAGLHSRIEATAEVYATGGTEPVWSRPLGDAEDTCSAPRRDYYVNYLLTLPETVAPGSYELRLTQQDTNTGQSASRSVRFSLTR